MLVKCPFPQFKTLFISLIGTVPLLLITLLLIGACQPKYNLEKRNAFEEMFSPGMSRSEVEHKLALLNDIKFLEEFQFPDNDLGLKYRAPIEQWGASIFIFRFSPDDQLLVVWAEMPTD